ncbi:PEP-CTERM sorting domain-containing protein [Thalassotalea sp. LPB0316]|uniref:PEP-CTERM sorting domain-containing protein n=1 Tax=Thalassotalea sp. LPB0316 TaxID=2769490 RepID=UPI0018691DA9|nr:PEP-CTERM sorting domain-containing protein [Thalassotalea sp. LPB0316]QOL25637.1 PEP-CTERM sorting domain-containing protein [Thalassotalea sp. LPB0316]
MKFKFLMRMVSALTLVVVSNANAGLIHNNLEWLDLSVTTGMSRNQVESTVLTQSEYQSYRYATQDEVNALYYDYIIEQNSVQVVNTAWHIAEDPNSDILQYFFTMTSGTTWNSSLSTVDGSLGYDQWDYNWGRLIYGADQNNQSSVTMYGWFHGMQSTNLPTYSAQVHLRSANDGSSLQATSPYFMSDSDAQYYNNSVLVRSVSVPEPSTLAVFALGLIGLVSRRVIK